MVIRLPRVAANLALSLRGHILVEGVPGARVVTVDGRGRGRSDQPTDLAGYRDIEFADEDMPPQIHGNAKLELGWTILPALILAGEPVTAVLLDQRDQLAGIVEQQRGAARRRRRLPPRSRPRPHHAGNGGAQDGSHRVGGGGALLEELLAHPVQHQQRQRHAQRTRGPEADHERHHHRPRMKPVREVLHVPADPGGQRPVLVILVERREATPIEVLQVRIGARERASQRQDAALCRSVDVRMTAAAQRRASSTCMARPSAPVSAKPDGISTAPGMPFSPTSTSSSRPGTKPGSSRRERSRSSP